MPHDGLRTEESAAHCVIRSAAADDVPALRRLMQLARVRVSCAPALVAEMGGSVSAAISLAKGRIIADPSRPTSHLTRLLRMRRDALLPLS
jgi:hypothetical protein